MKKDTTDYYMTDLLLRLIENEVDDQDIEAINEWFGTDPQANSKYLEFIKDYAAIKMYTESQLIPKQENAAWLTKSFDDNVWEALSEMETSAPPVEISKEQPEQELIQKVVYLPHEKHKISALNKFMLVAGAAAILFLIFFIKFAPEKKFHVEVATLVDQMNVKWGQSSTQFENGDRLSSMDGPFELKKGFLTIRFDDGVDVLIEGPTSFEIEHSGIFVEYGRLYSSVSERGVGFTVKTPTTQFVDLGTEFGIHADIHGSTELHVTKGQVQLFANSDNGPKISRTVGENNAVRFDAHSNRLSNIKINPKSFVRQIDSKRKFSWKGQSLDLADVLGGGNGFGTGKIQNGVSLNYSVINKIAFDESNPFKSSFIQIESPFVDRYFVPIMDSDVQVSSDGHSFSEFSASSKACQHGAYYTKVCQTDNFYTLNCEGRSLEEQNPAIWMHSNAGLTFSLRKLQNSLSTDIAIDRLTVQCCMLSETQYKYDIRESSNDNAVTSPKVDVLILIDGEVRFQQHELTPHNGIIPIDIPIMKQDHYLTFVVTDSGSTDFDWMVWANPTLHITKH